MPGRGPGVAATTERVRSDGSLRTLSGWGGQPRTTSEVVTPTLPRDLLDLEPSSRGYIPRGMGRSYGDAAQLGGGTVVDMTALTKMELDPERGVVSAQAGASMGQIIAAVSPHGWFIPVTPGTRHVTLGGAIAADVHGKNHHRDGSFGQYVESFDLITSDGREITAEPDDEAFAATVGGMGLTGTITRAALRLIPIETGWMTVDTARFPDIFSVMDGLLAADARYRYSVSWLDLSRRGRGRGVVMGGEHANAEEIQHRPRQPGDEHAVAVPGPGPGLVNRATVEIFNRIWFAKAPRSVTRGIQSIGSFFYPLDRLANWNRLYGKRGFLQYQFVVPDDRTDALTSIAETLAQATTPVALAVLKRMGTSDGGLMSFPIPGWTLAVDLPLGDWSLGQTLDDCDRAVAGAGGRVYFAKDSRLRPDIAHEMYPELGRWREVRSRLDPDGRLRSNLSQRLELTR